jgi:hypothetical protein
MLRSTVPGNEHANDLATLYLLPCYLLSYLTLPYLTLPHQLPSLYLTHY